VDFAYNSQVPAYSEIVRVAEVHAAAITLKGRDPTGKVSEGYICMTGPMRKSNQGLSRWVRVRVRRTYDWYDEGYDANGYRTTANTYYFLMGYRPRNPDDDDLRWEEVKIGLILERSEEASNTYKRVGMFEHPRRIPFSSERYAAELPIVEGCAEFASFDPENYERHTVKII
jgi:hypothetical protein